MDELRLVEVGDLVFGCFAVEQGLELGFRGARGPLAFASDINEESIPIQELASYDWCGSSIHTGCLSLHILPCNSLYWNVDSQRLDAREMRVFRGGLTDKPYPRKHRKAGAPRQTTLDTTKATSSMAAEVGWANCSLDRLEILL